MIGYIVMQHWHYDSTEPVSDPSVVYFDEDEAQAVAKQYDGSSQSGIVFPVEIDLDKAAERV